MLKKYTRRGSCRPRRQKATAAQTVPPKKIGFSNPTSAPRNSPAYLNVGFHAVPTPALSATWLTVTHWCCQFQIKTGRAHAKLTSKAKYGPGRRRCLRAGGQRANKTPQQRI